MRRIDSASRFAISIACALAALTVCPDVDANNEVESVWTWSEASSAGFPDGYTRTYLQDRNGNLITDGLFVYQYDAFNRLLQVNVPGSVVFDGDGRIVSGLLGSLILRYQYDAFGRLIRKPMPNVPRCWRSDLAISGPTASKAPAAVSQLLCCQWVRGEGGSCWHSTTELRPHRRITPFPAYYRGFTPSVKSPIVSLDTLWIRCKSFWGALGLSEPPVNRQ